MSRSLLIILPELSPDDAESQAIEAHVNKLFLREPPEFPHTQRLNEAEKAVCRISTGKEVK